MAPVTPHTTADLADAIRQAAAARTPVYPTAGGTQEHLFAPVPPDAGVPISLHGLNKIIDYPHRDLTVTVQAGVTVADLRRLLAEQGQVLPLDVPLPHQATIGGSVAANINGPRRTGWGTWRDYVIGLSFINDRGEDVKAGGRVVKNVAGYDLCKLMTGSFGTLGLLTQITLKVRPRPEKLALLPMTVKANQLHTLFELLRASRVRPSVFLITSLAGDAYRLDLAFEDSTAAVDWQLQHWRGEAQGQVDDIHNPLLQAEAEQQITLATAFPLEGTSVTMQAAVLGSQVANFVQQARPLVDRLQAYPGIGIVTGHLPATITLEEAMRTVTSLRQLATSLGGHLTLPRCPAAWRVALLPWGPPRPDWPMMRKIKHALDPHDLFQHARFEPLYAEMPPS